MSKDSKQIQVVITPEAHCLHWSRVQADRFPDRFPRNYVIFSPNHCFLGVTGIITDIYTKRIDSSPPGDLLVAGPGPHPRSLACVYLRHQQHLSNPASAHTHFSSPRSSLDLFSVIFFSSFQTLPHDVRVRSCVLYLLLLLLLEEEKGSATVETRLSNEFLGHVSAIIVARVPQDQELRAQWSNLIRLLEVPGIDRSPCQAGPRLCVT